MPLDDLSDEERAAVIAAARKVFDADKFPLSERMRPLKSALAKLDPPKPRAAPKLPIAGASEAAIRRQRALVDALTSGSRCSLSRAWRLAGWKKHHPSLDQLLASPGVMRLFREAVEAGRSLAGEVRRSHHRRPRSIGPYRRR
jgi:hypothetical protein